jgi:hypothetical protein
MIFARLLILLVVFTATPASADRAALAKSLCAPSLSDQISAIVALADAGAIGGAEEAEWAQTVVAAVEGRTLRCASSGVFLSDGDGAIDAITLTSAPAPVDAEAPPVNNRLRAVAASAAAVLTLFADPDPTARASAVAALERRREALSLPILDAAMSSEVDVGVIAGLESLRERLLQIVSRQSKLSLRSPPCETEP